MLSAGAGSFPYRGGVFRLLGMPAAAGVAASPALPPVSLPYAGGPGSGGLDRPSALAEPPLSLPAGPRLLGAAWPSAAPALTPAGRGRDGLEEPRVDGRYRPPAGVDREVVPTRAAQAAPDGGYGGAADLDFTASPVRAVEAATDGGHGRSADPGLTVSPTRAAAAASGGQGQSTEVDLAAPPTRTVEVATIGGYGRSADPDLTVSPTRAAETAADGGYGQSAEVDLTAAPTRTVAAADGGYGQSADADPASTSTARWVEAGARVESAFAAADGVPGPTLSDALDGGAAATTLRPGAEPLELTAADDALLRELAAGTGPFPFRGGVSRLLGMPAAAEASVAAPAALPPAELPYLAAQGSGEAGWPPLEGDLSASAPPWHRDADRAAREPRTPGSMGLEPSPAADPGRRDAGERERAFSLVEIPAAGAAALASARPPAVGTDDGMVPRASYRDSLAAAPSAAVEGTAPEHGDGSRGSGDGSASLPARSDLRRGEMRPLADARGAAPSRAASADAGARPGALPIVSSGVPGAALEGRTSVDRSLTIPSPELVAIPRPARGAGPSGGPASSDPTLPSVAALDRKHVAGTGSPPAASLEARHPGQDALESARSSSDPRAAASSASGQPGAASDQPAGAPPSDRRPASSLRAAAGGPGAHLPSPRRDAGAAADMDARGRDAGPVPGLASTARAGEVPSARAEAMDRGGVARSAPVSARAEERRPEGVISRGEPGLEPKGRAVADAPPPRRAAPAPEARLAAAPASAGRAAAHEPDAPSGPVRTIGLAIPGVTDRRMVPPPVRLDGAPELGPMASGERESEPSSTDTRRSTDAHRPAPAFQHRSAQAEAARQGATGKDAPGRTPEAADAPGPLTERLRAMVAGRARELGAVLRAREDRREPGGPALLRAPAGGRAAPGTLQPREDARAGEPVQALRSAVARREARRADPAPAAAPAPAAEAASAPPRPAPPAPAAPRVIVVPAPEPARAVPRSFWASSTLRSAHLRVLR
jgi:hypothetical protein